jgi:hypothetical protein
MNSLWEVFRPTSSSSQTSKMRPPSLLHHRTSVAGGFTVKPDTDGSWHSKHKFNPMSFLDLFSTGATVSSAPPLSPRDPLPGDSIKLEGILNYHLSQLDRIKRELREHNTTIEQLAYTLADLATHPEMKYTAGRLVARIQGVRNARNLLAKFVAFHLQEIERIMSLKRSFEDSNKMPNMWVVFLVTSYFLFPEIIVFVLSDMGTFPTVFIPSDLITLRSPFDLLTENYRFKQLPTDVEWNAMFSQ